MLAGWDLNEHTADAELRQLATDVMDDDQRRTLKEKQPALNYVHLDKGVGRHYKRLRRDTARKFAGSHAGNTSN